MGGAGSEAAGLGDRTSFSLSRPDPSLKSNTMLQSLSLRVRTGALSPDTSLNMGVGVRNSGGRGPERALNSFIQTAASNTTAFNRLSDGKYISIGMKFNCPFSALPLTQSHRYKRICPVVPIGCR